MEAVLSSETSENNYQTRKQYYSKEVATCYLPENFMKLVSRLGKTGGV
jgi:hypothetical protein